MKIQAGSQSKFAEALKPEVAHYEAYSPVDRYYAVLDDEQLHYSVVIVPSAKDERPSWVIVFARIVDEYIVIEEDIILDKPLVDALIHNTDIPREQSILAYQGETMPEQA